MPPSSMTTYPGSSSLSDPSPYTTHEPRLGLPTWAQPVFIQFCPVMWVNPSWWHERMTARSSACAATPGKRSETSRPERPCLRKVLGVPSSGTLSIFVNWKSRFRNDSGTGCPSYS